MDRSFERHISNEAVSFALDYGDMEVTWRDGHRFRKFTLRAIPKRYRTSPHTAQYIGVTVVMDWRHEVVVTVYRDEGVQQQAA